MQSIDSSAGHVAGGDQRQVGTLLLVGQQIADSAAAVRAPALLLGDVDAQAEAMAVLGQQADDLAVLGVARRQLVDRAQHDLVGLGVAVALEDLADELRIGRVVAAEHARDALEEGRLAPSPLTSTADRRRPTPADPTAAAEHPPGPSRHAATSAPARPRRDAG